MVGETVSHYKIMEKLGSGGMGEVFLAEDTKLNRRVALKFLPAQLVSDEEFKARFTREAQAAAKLNHPNIITIHEVSEHNGRSYFAMEHVEGRSLKDFIKSGELSAAQAIDIVIQICEGLQAAHKAGIVHRDIKPANILIDEDGRCRILDFGLAAIQSEEKLTKSGSSLGTVHYMSPEQVQGEKVEHRSDIFSLGVVFYEMIAGQLPFKGDYDAAIIYSIVNDAPEPLAQYNSEATEDLQRIVDRALEKNRELRYQQISDLLADLKRTVAEGESHVIERKYPSVAVMPFADMSAEKDQEFFCDGMAEEIISALTRVENLRVLARTSAFSFKGKDVDIREIGRKLNVKTLLEGSVRRSGNRLRITAQLISVSDGYHLWSQRYDREMEDIFNIQDEISLSVVDNLKVRLLGGEKTKILKRFTDEPEAYRLYLMGLFYFRQVSESSVQEAIEYFNRAIEKSPDYALAYAMKSYCFVSQGWLDYVPPHRAFPDARSMAIKAIELDPNLGEARNILGLIKTYYDWDWTGAEIEFEKAMDLSPNFAAGYMNYAAFFLMVGDLEKAIEMGKKALELDPLNPTISFYLSIFLMRSGIYREAEEYLLNVIEFDADYMLAYWMLGHLYVLEKKYEDGLKKIKHAAEISKENDLILGGLGWAYAVSGCENKAQEIIDKLEAKAKKEYVRPYMFAKIYAALGKKDLAFEWLEKAYDEHDISLCAIYSDETIENLRSDKRYEELLRKLNLNK